MNCRKYQKLHLSVILPSLIFFAACNTASPQPANNNTPTTKAESSITIKITRAEYGEEWPFTVDEGMLQCFSGGVIFTANKITYALNKVATDDEKHPEWKVPDQILANNPKLPGTRISMSKVISKGLELCQ